MIKRRCIAPGLAFVLFVLTLLILALNGKLFLDRYTFKPGVIETIASSQTPIAYQGLILQEKALESSDVLPVYGSSEFSAVSEFHPSTFFNGKKDGFVPFLIGRGGSQSLVHVLSLAAQGEKLQGKKVMIILSPQWFLSEGITSQYLKQNFSPLQTYQILYNPDISGEIKQELSSRLLEFPEVLKKYPMLKQNLKYYSKIETHDTPLKSLVHWTGRAEQLGLEVLDVYNTATFVPLVNKQTIAQNAANNAPQTPDWGKLEEAAEKKGLESTGNNSWGILNSYYTEYLEPDLAKSSGSQSQAKLYPSPEYQDLQLLMKVLKEQGAKAMFVIVPVNGFWYDYTGFPVQERAAYYTRIKTMVQENGFELADFSQHEYDRYFLQDIMHLGWKGWVAVDQAMDQFYHERS